MAGREGVSDGPMRRGLGLALAAASALGVFGGVAMLLLVGLWAAALTLVATILGLYGSILLLLPPKRDRRSTSVGTDHATERWSKGSRGGGEHRS